MKKFLKLRHGQKGFTLIELLVVVAILGVLAAIIIPNVSKFIGTGTVQAANTEAHNVQTAVVAYMADNNLTNAAGTVGPVADIPTGGPGDGETSVHSFLVNPGSLQAIYTISTEGAITGAAALADGKWKDLKWVNGWVP